MTKVKGRKASHAVAGRRLPRRHLLRNLSSQWVLYGVNALMLLLVTPLLVHCLGPEAYGLWILGGNFVFWLMIMDFGIGDAAVRHGAILLKESRIRELNEMLDVSAVIFAGLGIGVLIVALLVGWLAPPKYFSTALSRPEFLYFVLLLAGGLAFSFWGQTYASILQAGNRFDIVNAIRGGALVLRIVGFALVAWSGGGVLDLAAVTCLSGLATLIGMARLSTRVHVWTPSVSPGEWMWIRRLAGFGLITFLVTLADVARFQVDSLVLSTFGSLSDVTIFSIGSTLPMVLGEIAGSSSRIFLPILSRGYLDAAALQRFLLASRVFAVLLWCAGGLMMAFGGAFIALWVGNGFDGSIAVMHILLPGWVVAASQAVAFSLVFGLASHAGLAWLSLVDAVANVALSIYLVRDYGAEGVALGTAVPLLVSYGFVFPWMVSVAAGCSFWGYFWNGVAYPAMCGLVAGVVGWAGVHAFAPESWGGFLMMSAVALFGVGSMAWFAVGKDARGLVQEVVSSV